MSILTIVVIIILVFVGVIFAAIARAVAAVLRVRRKFREAFSGTSDDRRESDPRRHRGRDAEAARRKKKIGRDVGEYVEFEEVACTVETDDGSSSTTYTATEQQVTDVEWEDVK